MFCWWVLLLMLFLHLQLQISSSLIYRSNKTNKFTLSWCLGFPFSNFKASWSRLAYTAHMFVILLATFWWLQVAGVILLFVTNMQSKSIMWRPGVGQALLALANVWHSMACCEVDRFWKRMFWGYCWDFVHPKKNQSDSERDFNIF